MTAGAAGASRPRVAVIGLGGMGGGMAHRLVEQGYEVRVHNRDRRRSEPLGEAGATVSGSPADAVRGASVVLLSLSDEHAVTEVFAGGLLDALDPGTLVLDATTVSPSFAVDSAARVARCGAARVELCVVGNPAMAGSGRLRVFTAGEPAAAERAAPVLGAIATEVTHVGDGGTAATMKLAFNLLLGAQVGALAEAVALGESAGVDRSALLDAITGSGFSSPVLGFRAGFMRSREYQPAAFRAELMAKDLHLACGAAEDGGITLPVTERVRATFADAVAAGYGASDAAVVLELVAAASPSTDTTGVSP